MKLQYLELYNYIGIYNGMGLNLIQIDFSKCIHNITVIKGDNGSGKSSLFKTIHPFGDNHSELIPNANAHKRIVYLINNNTLDIRYDYPIDTNGERKKTKCTIIYNGKDLNPNKNMTDGRDIICDILDIDIGFLSLAELSSDDRGLADKSPSERKKFINNKISELDAFNNIYKKISKKSSQLKGMVDSVNNKIKSIGNINIINTNIKMMSSRLEDLEEQKTMIIVDMSKIQSRLEELDKTYDKSKYNSLQSNILELRHKLSLISVDDTITEEVKNNMMNKLTKDQTDLKVLKELYNNKLSDMSSIKDTISSLEIQLNGIGDPKLIKIYEDRISIIKDKQKKFDLLCKSNHFDNYRDISEIEYKYALETIKDFRINIEEIKNKYSYDELVDSIDILSRNNKYSRITSKEELDEMKNNLNKMKSIIDQQDFFKKTAKDINLIPCDCPHKKDCPFIKGITESYNSLLSDEDYNKTIEDINYLEKDIQDYIKEMKREDIIDKCLYDLSVLFDNNSTINKPTFIDIMNKFKIKYIKNNDDLNKCLKSILLSNSTEWYYIDIQYFSQIINSFIESKSYEKEISKLEKEASKLYSNKELSEYISAQLKDNYNKLEDKTNDIERDKLLLKKLENDIFIESNDLSNIEKQIEDNINYKKYNEEYMKLLEEDKIYKVSIENYNKLENEINKKKDVLDDLISNQIPKITDEINENKYKLVLYNDYVREYKEYTKSFDKIEIIKKYCSPTTGIQTVYMNMYMNNILGISNQLISMFFGGSFILQPFVINEKEFKMPVLGSGILNDDISSMSTAQICMISMIISFALLSKSSSIYNIVKIDEMDSSLDTNNRLAFFNVLSTLMNSMNFTQCIMISHNTELNINNMDVIILKNSDPTLHIDGNVIYNYENEKIV